MTFTNDENFDGSRPTRVGVLITNLGTPEAPERGALRTFLKEFLSDPRVVEVPRLLWWFILNGIILNLRPSRSAKAYREIWTPEGSPLLVHTRALTEEIASKLKHKHGDDLVVDFAMRYGQPAIETKLQKMMEAGVTDMVVLPLYPQYSGPTTASTFDALAADFSRRRRLPALHFIAHYYDHPGYIAALAEKVNLHWQEYGRAEKLIFSYHGVPRNSLDKGDPYYHQCLKTTRLVVAALGLEESEYLTTFQSRFGLQEWLKPYTDEILKSLPGEGSKSVQILCPGFATDCLETLEEIEVENRDYFIAAGGERYEYIPCLNSDALHVEALVQVISEQLSARTR